MKTESIHKAAADECDPEGSRSSAAAQKNASFGI